MSIKDRSAVTELLTFHTLSKKTKKMKVDKRDFYSLSYRYSGKISIKTEDCELISEKNSITFMPKGISYETEILEDTQMAVVHFKLVEDIDFRNPVVLLINDDSIHRLFEQLVRSFRVDVPLDFACMAIFYELLSKLETLSLTESEKQIPIKIRSAREYMQQNFSDSLFSVSQLAERFGISTAYLRREFSRAYGKCPVSMLCELRISKAKNLLESEYLTVSEIAEQSGFSCASYFIQVFHRATGLSPEKYRQKNVND